MQRAASRAANIVRFVGPPRAATRAYSSVPVQNALENAAAALNHAFRGVKPKFSVGGPPELAKQRVKEIEDYIALCEGMKREAADVARECAKDASKAFFAKVVAVMGILLAAIVDADKDMEKITKEVEDEKARLAKEIRAKTDDAEIVKADLDRLEKEAQDWMVWFRGENAKAQQACKSELTRIAVKITQLERDIAAQDVALANVQQILKARAKQREEIILSL